MHAPGRNYKSNEVEELSDAIHDNFRKNLKFVMKQKDMSQTELAKMIHIHRVTLNRILNGKVAPSLAIAVVLSIAVEEPLSRLCGYEETERKFY